MQNMSFYPHPYQHLVSFVFLIVATVAGIKWYLILALICISVMTSAKFRLKLNKGGKTTRSFRHGLNQIPYDYIVEVTNRFNGLSYTVPEELWTEVHDTVQEAVIKTIPRKKKCKETKWLSEEALQIAEKRKNIPFQVGRFLLLLSFCC